MLEKQVALAGQIGNQWRQYKEMMPGIAKAYDALSEVVYAEGAIDTKTKRLMAMTAAITGGCRACILFQARQALDAGATVEEIMECIGVATSLGGSMASGQACRLLGLLEEENLL